MSAYVRDVYLDLHGPDKKGELIATVNSLSNTTQFEPLCCWGHKLGIIKDTKVLELNFNGLMYEMITGLDD